MRKKSMQIWISDRIELTPLNENNRRNVEDQEKKKLNILASALYAYKRDIQLHAIRS